MDTGEIEEDIIQEEEEKIVEEIGVVEGEEEVEVEGSTMLLIKITEILKHSVHLHHRISLTIMNLKIIEVVGKTMREEVEEEEAVEERTLLKVMTGPR